MIIREGTEPDIIKISRLWLDMVKEMKPEYEPNVEWWRKIALQHLRSGIYYFYVADDGGKIVGFIDFFMYPEPSTGKKHCVGQHFFLKPEYRGKTTGRELYERSLSKGKKLGAKIIELFCFENERAMWKRKGFKSLRTLMRMEVSDNV